MAHPNFLLNTRTLVVGGSSGLGFAVASGALSSGSKVHITSVTAEKLSAKISQLQSLYPGAHVSGSTADLSNTETLEVNLQSVLNAAIEATGGPLDHIVFTAGDLIDRPTLAELTAAKILLFFTVRYVGPLLIGKLVAAHPGKYLAPSASSSITLTSGTLANKPRPGFIAFNGAVGSVEPLTRALAVELAPIRVNAIIPGTVHTELLDRVSGGNVEMYKEMSLTKQLGTPEGAAEAYLFCMRSALATGQSFMVDSGSTLV
ncbi:hypothetical protein B0H13DRAFT_1997698 [Mycena leptocephala]|nr:hypothetical protein B0H13DRAFT_1997698 [Mycena leptocephala]